MNLNKNKCMGNSSWSTGKGNLISQHHAVLRLYQAITSTSRVYLQHHPMATIDFISATTNTQLILLKIAGSYYFLCKLASVWLNKAIIGYLNTSFSLGQYCALQWRSISIMAFRVTGNSTNFPRFVQASHTLKRITDPENSPHKKSL